MVSVTHATASDLPAIAHMRLDLGWHPNRWLLEAMQRSESGRLFLVREPLDRRSDLRGPDPAGGILALASAIAYGPRGFIGNVIVQERARRRGLGRMVMAEALDWLRRRGVLVVELDATPEGRPLYERLGFVGTGPSWFMHAPIADEQRRALARLGDGVRVETVEAGTLSALGRLDRQAFGGDRLGLLCEVAAAGGSRLHASYDERGELVGYLMARSLEDDATTLRLGPWVAESPRNAAALLLHAVAAHGASVVLPPASPPKVLACVDGTNPRAAWLAHACGLPLVEDDLRMRLVFEGDGVEANPQRVTAARLGQSEWVYAMMAPMVG